MELGEGLDRLLGVLAVLGVADVLDCLLRRRLGRFRHGVEDVGGFVNPAPLLAGGGEDLAQGLPEPESAIADRQHGRAHAPSCAVPQQPGPRLGRFPVAVGHGHQFLGAVRAHADDHQDGGLDFVQAYAQVDAVDPDVDVVGAGQVALLERLVVGLPLGGQPGDGGRREPGGGAEELFQRGHEVPGGQAVQTPHAAKCQAAVASWVGNAVCSSNSSCFWRQW